MEKAEAATATCHARVKARLRSFCTALFMGAAMLSIAGCAAQSIARPPVADGTGLSTFDVGGAEVRFRPIEGWCPVTDDQYGALAEDAGREVIIYAAFGDCRQVEAARGRDGLPANIGVVATSPSLEDIDVGSDRAAFIDRVVENSADLDLGATAKEAEDAARAMRSRLEAARRAGIDIQIGDPIDLGLLGHDELAAYFGILQKIRVSIGADSGEIGLVTIFCTTEIQNRFILVAIQTQTGMLPATGERPSIAAALDLARSQVERLIELNPDPGLAI